MEGECIYSYDKFKDLSFSFDGTHYFTVPKNFYLDDGQIKVAGITTSVCLLSIISNTKHPSDYALGGAFLRAWYTIYDYHNMRLGLAKPKMSNA